MDSDDRRRDYVPLGAAISPGAVRAADDASFGNDGRRQEKNLGNTIRRSEKSLNNYFDEPHIIEMGDEVWTSISKTKLSEYFGILG
ncbi:MAG: hypothetical protein R6W76_10560, partial [Caldilinea sp.]